MGLQASDDPRTAVARAYRDFARHEARGRSANYESLGDSVARDDAVVRFVASLPPDKRQPQLLFAAARYLLGAQPGALSAQHGPPRAQHGALSARPGEPLTIGQLHELVKESPAELTEVILTHRTQTNEPARCAVFLPALAQLPPPLALIEVGASAGLNLLFDRYSYDYAGHRLTGGDRGAPTLRCEPRGPVPLPARIPEIAWRAGLDLNPLDVTNDDDVRWLRCLVWPGEGDREQRLAQAVASARRDPPAVHRGDLLTDLPALAAQAPPSATLVIYHSSVLYQVDPDLRRRFIAAVRGQRATWLSCEDPGSLPGMPGPGAENGDRPENGDRAENGDRPENGDRSESDGLQSVLARDGYPIAFADSHGTWLRWLRA